MLVRWTTLMMLGCLACGGDRGSRVGWVSVDTVNGIPITRNGPVEGAPPAAATAETVLRMGGADAPRRPARSGLRSVGL